MDNIDEKQIDEIVMEDKPKKKRIPIKRYKAKETLESSESSESNIDMLKNVAAGTVEAVRDIIPDQSLDVKKMRLRQYMRSRPMVPSNAKGVLPADFDKVDKMSENQVDAKLETYDFYQNIETTTILSETVIQMGCGSIDNWTDLNGAFTKRCMADESLKADITDELSRFAYFISRPIRILSRLTLNAIEAYKERFVISQENKEKAVIEEEEKQV